MVPGVLVTWPEVDLVYFTEDHYVPIEGIAQAFCVLYAS